MQNCGSPGLTAKEPGGYGTGYFLTSADVSLEPVFQARGVPKVLFAFPPDPNAYDVSANGQRFVKFGVASADSDQSASPIKIVLNWPAGVNRKIRGDSQLARCRESVASDIPDRRRWLWRAACLKLTRKPHVVESLY
jgi:hypothetical protein